MLCTEDEDVCGRAQSWAKAHQAVNTAPLLLIVVRWRGGGGAAGGPSLRRRCAESAVMCTTPGEPLCSMRAAAPRRGAIRLELCAQARELSHSRSRQRVGVRV